MHHFEKAFVDTYRQAILDDKEGSALVATLEGVRQSGLYEIGDATRKTVPRGTTDLINGRASFYTKGLRPIWPVSRWLLQVLRGGD